MVRSSQPRDVDVIRHSLGDPAEFRELFERHHDRVRAYVVTRIGPALADDCVADTFLEAFRIRSRFDGSKGSDALPWLMGMPTNVITRHRAAEQRWIRG